MSTPIEDYAIIGDTKTVAAVAREGSIDWWCVPRIDSGAVFAALVGEPHTDGGSSHRRGTCRPAAGSTSGETLVLETEHETSDGTVKVTDFMSPGLEHPTIFRLVEGLSGSVPMHLELIARFDYGSIAPWAQSTGDGLTLVAGSDALRFHSPGATRRASDLHDDRRVHRDAKGSGAASRWRGTPRSKIRRRRSTRQPRCVAPSSTGPSGRRGAPTRESGATTSCGRSSR